MRKDSPGRTYAPAYACGARRGASQCLSKALLSRVLDAVVTYSVSLDVGRRRTDLAVNRKSIGESAFDHKRGPVTLSELERVDDGRSRRASPALGADDLISILSACRTLLGKQYAVLGRALGKPDPARFETTLCRELGLSDLLLKPDHFDIQRLFCTASTPAAFGLPDMITWEGIESVGDFGRAQRAGMEILRSLRTAIQMAPNDDHRLSLVYTAVSIATMHHPGEPTHHEALLLAHDAANAAGLGVLARSRDDAKRANALRVATQLESCAFTPILNSPTNYLPLLLARRRLEDSAWRRVQNSVDVAIALSRQQVQLAPSSTRVLREHAATASLKARLLLASNHDGRDAKALDREATICLEKVEQPYARLYPILRKIVREEWRGAADGCDQAAARQAAGGDKPAEQAFGVLKVNIIQMQSGRMQGFKPSLMRKEFGTLYPRRLQYSHSCSFEPADAFFPSCVEVTTHTVSRARVEQCKPATFRAPADIRRGKKEQASASSEGAASKHQSSPPSPLRPEAEAETEAGPERRSVHLR